MWSFIKYGFWVMCSLFQTFIILFFLTDIFLSSEFNSKMTFIDINKISDSIHYAQQLGRLDIISLLLAVFGVLFAVFAIGWMSSIKQEAKFTTQETVEVEMKSERIKCVISDIVKETVENIIRDDEDVKAIMASIIEQKTSDIVNSTEFRNRMPDMFSDHIENDIGNEIAEGGLDGSD